MGLVAVGLAVAGVLGAAGGALVPPQSHGPVGQHRHTFGDAPAGPDGKYERPPGRRKVQTAGARAESDVEYGSTLQPKRLIDVELNEFCISGTAPEVLQELIVGQDRRQPLLVGHPPRNGGREEEEDTGGRDNHRGR